MQRKTIALPDIGRVELVKNSRNRNIRLTVNDRGVRISLPIWTTYGAGIRFAETQRAWILEQQSKQKHVALRDGDKLGKLHVLRFETVPANIKPTTRITATKLTVMRHATEPVESPAVQERAEKAAIRALRKEAQVVLPNRLRELAEKYGLN
ncbi:DUF45 domain-containing protein, partial [Candidatus Saccharibacteria bacterium]|nr:DUF45 domain-containing protein [Candidatus Saccharibacteria bacterium]